MVKTFGKDLIFYIKNYICMEFPFSILLNNTLNMKNKNEP